MKYVIFTAWGEGLPIAERLQEEGQEVTVGIVHDMNDTATPEEGSLKEKPEENLRRLRLKKGMLDIYDAWKLVRALKKVPNPGEYFIFFDFNCLFKFAKELSGLGFNGNFPTLEDRRMETDREMAKDFVKKYYPDIQVAPVENFAKTQEAEKFMEETEDIWCLKGNDSSCRTVVPLTTDVESARQEIIEALHEQEKALNLSGMVLEKKIDNVIEVTPQMVFWNGRPIYASMDLELKRLCAGDIGPMTGCSGDLVFPIDIGSKICQMAFPEAVHELARNHPGMFVWDLSILFDRKTGTPYMGEFCPNRVGYNAFYTELAQLHRASDFFEYLIKNENPFEKARAGEFGASVRIFSPHDDPSLLSKPDLPIYVRPDVSYDTWLMDAYKDKKDKIVTNGFIWDVGVVTGVDHTVESSIRKAFENLEGVLFEEKIHRPMWDLLYRDYPTSIMCRLDYLIQHDLITFPRYVSEESLCGIGDWSSPVPYIR